MSQVLEKLLTDVQQLSTEEMKTLLSEINRQIERAESVRAALQKIRGKGKGVWQQDAQDFINESRADERL